MKKILLFALIIFLFFSNKLICVDTTWVQTFTFDDITKRRGTFKFPDNTDNYRKILMYYTLKCDPKTAHDIYECGEWDAGTYCIVHQHTGILDSTLLKAPKYNFGRDFPDKIEYTTTPTYTKFIKSKKNIISGHNENDVEYIIADGENLIKLENQSTKLQILLTKDYLKSNNLSSKQFKAMKLKFHNSGFTIKNLKIQYSLTSVNTLDEFVTSKFNTLYENDLKIDNPGWQTIYFYNKMNSTSLQGLIIQISFEKLEGANELELSAFNNSDCLIAQGKDKFLSFDGKYDYSFSSDIDKLKNSDKFTIEFKSRLNAWLNYGYIFSLNNIFEFRTVEEYRQPKRYYINFSDSISYGIYVGGTVNYNSEWQHFAIVFDGSKDQYDGKIKFFVNGVEVQGFIRGLFPNAIPTKDIILKLAYEKNNYNCDIDEFRIWNTNLSQEIIQAWKDKPLNNSHPNYSKLILYYSMNQIDNYTIIDESGNNYNSQMIGVPKTVEAPIEDILSNVFRPNNTPNLALIEGEINNQINEILDTIIVENEPLSLITYKLENKSIIIDTISYVWAPGTFYTYDENGISVDSVIIEADNILKQDTIEYYSEPTENINDWEISRFITPYGIHLSLGPNGFTWIYDVTEYASLLQGNVDLTAHNQQELIDLKFAFIEGTPPYKVLKIDRPWGPYKSYYYKDLDNDTQLSETQINLLPETKNIILRSRLTGHGHNSNDGKYPYCCEWKDNTHYLFANGNQIANWHIWRYYQCGMNPVYPQGGTWPGRREGWCPGDVVYNYDFNLTEFILNNSIKLDYDITPVPQDNQGMGNGIYIIAMHLFELSELTHSIDAELYDVITPNKIPYYSRLNPICANPLVVVRNNGKEAIQSLNFKYSVSGGIEHTFNWTGNIGSLQKDTIELPIGDANFWLGDDQHKFTVTVSNPNGKQDEYNDNDSFTTEFILPDLYNERFVIWYKTNNEPQYYTYEIKDIDGNIVFSKTNLEPNKLYKDEIILPDGCYTLEFSSLRHTGLSYWAYSGQGSGYLRIYDKQENLLKSFNPDFGAAIIYSFDLGGVTNITDPGYENLIEIYPNPSSDFVNISINGLKGNAVFELFNLEGKLLSSKNINLNGGFIEQIDLNNFESSTLFIRIYNDKYHIVKQININK